MVSELSLITENNELPPLLSPSTRDVGSILEGASACKSVSLRYKGRWEQLGGLVYRTMFPASSQAPVLSTPHPLVLVSSKS